MKRWPIRIRLTAGFAVMMALVLAGAAITTLSSFRAAFDESIDHTQAARLHALTAAPLVGSMAPGPGSPVGSDTATQVLDSARGTVLTSSAQLDHRALLTPAEVATAARDGELRVQRPASAGLPGPVRILSAPTRDGREVAVVATSLAGRDAAVADLRDELAISLPLVLLVAIAGAYVIGAAALRPVERMRARAATISVEDPDPRLPIPPAQDEIARLAATLNDLLTRLHDALDRERRFVADASHELRTPLGLLTTELELALRRPRGVHELTAALGSALEETERLSRLAQDLLLLARADQPDCGARPQRHPTVTELAPLLASVIARHRPVAGDHAVIVDCKAGLAALVDADDCDRAVSNLVDNALQHGAAPIIIRVCSTPVDRAPDGVGAAVTIEVRDHGTGFDPDFLPRAFDRFTRADPARTRGGTGLGLAITAALAARNHGQVRATNYPDGGAGVILILPAAPTSISAFP
ncbi:MAG: ATP-binding protein [Pseudonocardiaceae bacterium]